MEDQTTTPASTTTTAATTPPASQSAAPSTTLLTKLSNAIIKLDSLTYTFPMLVGSFVAGWALATAFHRFIW